MNRLIVMALMGASLVLQACSSTPYTVKGVPGYTKAGKAKSPYVKLGRAYRIKGRTYYPKHEPDYDEMGVASWYGPNFHGKSTANGEIFNQYDMTAAHKTLPLPSVVRVTHRKNGKRIIVRVNDRGPYADDRIIDLSKLAAQKLDMIGTGTAPVRVEYLPEESHAYVAQLALGKRPSEINFVRDVLEPVQYARARNAPAVAYNETKVEPVQVAELSTTIPAKPKKSFWDVLNPIADVFAAEPAAKPVKTIRTDQLPPIGVPQQAAPAVAPAAVPTERSPFDLLANEPAAPEPTGEIPATLEPPPAQPVAPAPAPVARGLKPAPTDRTPAEVLAIGPHYFVQIGAFSQPANVDAIARTFSGDASVERTPIQMHNGSTLTRVRLGPVTSRAQAERLLAKAHANNMRDARLTEEK